MRILVVDDEIVNREKMEKIMATFGECVAVASGPEALDAMERAIDEGDCFGLVTLDVLMTGMDGTEVLYNIRDMEQQKNITKDKRAKVIMVTSQSDKSTVVTSKQVGCDSYVVKPFNRTIMVKRLEELGICGLDSASGGESIRKVILKAFNRFQQGKIIIPPLPKIVREIEAVMSKPASSIEHLREIIEKDLVISSKVIATANSAFYRRADNASDLRTAIARIGNTEIQHIVSALANRNLYDNKHELFRALSKKIGLHSLCSAYCCRVISSKLGNLGSGKVFLMGLTHDIGAVLLLKSIGDIAPDTKTFNMKELMDSILEVNAIFSVAILTEWGLGREFADVVRLHRQSSFEKGTNKEVLIVNLAEKISTKIDYGFFDNNACLSNLESAETLGIDDDALAKVAEEVKVGMKDIELIFS